MTFGFECEYFIERDGAIITPVPTRFPRDGGQNLVEVRSSYYKDPQDTLESFLEARVRLDRSLNREGYTRSSRTRWFLEKNDLETAGFHIHFGENRCLDIPKILSQLDLQFYSDIAKAMRVPSQYRMKPYGFEYRSLPCDVDLNSVLAAARAIPKELV